MELLEKEYESDLKEIVTKIHEQYLHLYNEPMDGDMVDEVTNFINKELNLLNGNIDKDHGKNVCLFKFVDVILSYPNEDGTYEHLCAIGDYSLNCPRCQEWDDRIFYWFTDEQDIKRFYTPKKNGSPVDADNFIVKSYLIRK